MILINYLIICFVFGTTFLAIKLGIDAGAPPLFSAGIRFFLAGSFVILYFRMHRKVSWRQFGSKQVALLGFCLTFMTFSTLYLAEQFITSGMAAILSATGPIMILVLLTIFQKRKLHATEVLSFFLAFLGVSLLCLQGLHQEISTVWITACLIVLLGQLFYSIGTILTKRLLQQQSDVSPFFLNGLQMAYGGGYLLIVSFVFEQPTIHVLAEPSILLSTLYLMVVGSIMGHGLYYWLIQRTNPVFPATWLYISPLIAVFFGIIFLKESLSLIMIVGIPCIVLGVVMANIRTLKVYWKEGSLLRQRVS